MRFNSVQRNPPGFSGGPALVALTALIGAFGTLKKEKSSHLNLAEVAEPAISPRSWRARFKRSQQRSTTWSSASGMMVSFS